MIAGNIENSYSDAPDSKQMNAGNEWLQVVTGIAEKKKPALTIKKPLYPVRKSNKQIRGAKHG